MYLLWGKRLFDIVISIASLILLSPVMVVCIILNWCDSGWPVFFRQHRPGLKGRPFTMYKFRTMTEGHDAQGNLLPDAQRLTPFGYFLRSTSLDELPELWNVVRGDMSLVGPRPLLMRYAQYYSDRERKRFDVRPGITGWAQIHGRNDLAWADRFQLDVWYVEHMSFLVDLKIILRSLFKVIRKEGVRVLPTNTMQDLNIEREAKRRCGREK